MPFFYMGPLLNLRRMREEGFWSHFLEVHQHLGFEEQLTLALATAGRIKPLNKRFNLVPRWEKPDEPLDCVLHYTTPEKPWNSEGEFNHFWESEVTTWEQLRTGKW